MKHALSIVLNGLVLLVLSASTVSAQGKASHAQRRLPPAAVGGKWNVAVSLSVATDTRIVTAELRAEAPIRGWLQTAIPTLIVRCQTPREQDETVRLSTKGLLVQPGLDVYLDTGMAASVDRGDGTHAIGVRFDAEPVEHWGTVESADSQALFLAPLYATQLVARLTHSRRLLVEFTPLNAPPATIAFDTRGFKIYAARVLAACPAVDRTKGRYPPGVEPLTGPTEPLIGRYIASRSGLGVLKAGRRAKRAAVRMRVARSRHLRRRAASRA